MGRALVVKVRQKRKGLDYIKVSRTLMRLFLITAASFFVYIFSGACETEAAVYRSGNVPGLFLETEEPLEELQADKANVSAGKFTLYLPGGREAGRGEIVQACGTIPEDFPFGDVARQKVALDLQRERRFHDEK